MTEKRKRLFKISNPYEGVTELLGNNENHYKTNLHSHTTYSDANSSMSDMIDAYYDNDFDILAITDHGILGKQWDKTPTIIPLYLFQYLWHGKRKHPTSVQYRKILDGSHKTQNNLRTKKRGLQCVPGGIEANMWTLRFNHVNGFFTDDRCEGVFGKENDFEEPVRKIEESGGVSHINHPTDWLRARWHPDCGTKKENVEFFADIFRRYKSCLGIEVLNMYDIPNRCDRILWDSLLKTLIPEGERSIIGFSNSDAHEVKQVDTAFMDFILPEYSLSNLRGAMEKGSFFSIARYAKNELGEDFEGKGPVPTVTGIEVNSEKQTIRIKGVNCHTAEWIADGRVIESVKLENDGEITSVLNLSEHDDSISCYVRAQLKGQGGICLTQAFVLDDGNMERFIVPATEKKALKGKEKLIHKFYNTRLGVIINKDKGLP